MDEADAEAVRRAVLGDAYVDAQAGGAFQDFVTATAWGVWARGDDVLSRRDRSLLVLAMTAALGRMEEFGLHVRAARTSTGVTDGELDELLLHIAAYCGVPAGVAAARAVRGARAAADDDG